MIGIYLISGIGAVAGIGMFCILWDMVFPENHFTVTKPKPITVYSDNSMVEDSYDDIDILINEDD